jgi:hypothetical protein
VQVGGFVLDAEREQFGDIHEVRFREGLAGFDIL